MNALKEQLLECIAEHGGLFAEYELNNNDYLLVHFDYDNVNDGLLIKGDFELDKRFSGDVIECNLGFIIPFEADYFDNLDHYLQQASDEINEGYLLVNGLI